jgi:ABC-type nitrate/sulfonate/bicarbonate transport system substrate-binding protein
LEPEPARLWRKRLELSLIADTPSSPTLSRPAGAKTLRLGYLPLTDSAPLLVAQERRFFARHGVRVELSRHTAWSALRDRMAFDQLDGGQMLAPMPLALSLGLGGPQRDISVTATLNRNGNTIVLGSALMEMLARPVSARALATCLLQRQASGAKPAVFAVVFAFSSHNYLLRDWLASGGIDPERDVRLIVVPPSQVVTQLAAGAIDGFCAGEPWGSLAVESGVGQIALTSADIWPNHPEKLLAFAQYAAGCGDESALIAATAAVIEAGHWADEPGNREEVIRLLARDALPEIPPTVIARVLDGGLTFAPDGPTLPTHRMVFAEGGASYPSAAQGGWYYEQMQRWGHLLDPAAPMPDVWRSDLWSLAAGRLGITAPPVGPYADAKNAEATA